MAVQPPADLADPMAATRALLASAAAASDLSTLYRAWSNTFVPDDEMAALTVRCSLADLMAWAAGISDRQLAGLTNGEPPVSLNVTALEMVKLQAKFLSFLFAAAELAAVPAA